MSKPQTFEDAQKIHERIKAKHVHEVKEDFFENFLLHAKSFEDAFFILKASRQALSTTSLSLFERVFYNWVDNYNDGYQLFEMLSVLPKIESKYLSICVDLLGLYEGTFQEDSIEKVFAYLEHFPYRSSNKVLKNYAEKCINLIGRIPSVKLAKKFFHLMTTYLGPVHIPLDKALFPIQRESDPGICLGYLFTIRLSLPGKSVSPEMIADIACNKVNSVENAKSFVKVYHPKFNGLEVKPETKACLAKFQIYL